MYRQTSESNENKDSKVYFNNRRIVGYFIFLLLCGLSVLLASEAKIVMRLERRSAKTEVKKHEGQQLPQKLRTRSNVRTIPIFLDMDLKIDREKYLL